MGIAMDAVIAGRYRILESLGVGAVSEVFGALDLEEDRPVALKMLRRGWDDETTRRRLVLLEALTGHREYTGTAAERAVASAHRPPHIPPALGAPWCHVLHRMTARDPALRPKIDEVSTLLRVDGSPPS